MVTGTSHAWIHACVGNVAPEKEMRIGLRLTQWRELDEEQHSEGFLHFCTTVCPWAMKEGQRNGCDEVGAQKKGPVDLERSVGCSCVGLALLLSLWLTGLWITCRIYVCGSTSDSCI